MSLTSLPRFENNINKECLMKTTEYQIVIIQSYFMFSKDLIILWGSRDMGNTEELEDLEDEYLGQFISFNSY